MLLGVHLLAINTSFPMGSVPNNSKYFRNANSEYLPLDYSAKDMVDLNNRLLSLTENSRYLRVQYSFLK